MIPNLNGEQFIGECLESIRCQTHKRIEILVVDNGSSDGSVDLVERAFSEATLIKFESNRGFAAAVNAGISAARGEYIALLNNDARVEPTWIAELLEVLVSDGAIAAAMPKVLQAEPVNGKVVFDSTGDWLSIWGFAIPRGRDTADVGQYDRGEEVFSASGAASVYRRSALQLIGGFDEDFFAYYEDVDCSFRLRHTGYSIRYVPSAVVWHQLGKTSGGKRSGWVRYLSVRNSWCVVLKNMPFPLIVMLLPSMLLGQLLLLANSVRKGMFRWHLRALKETMEMLPSMLAKRRSVLSSSTLSNRWIADHMVNTLAVIMPRRRS